MKPMKMNERELAAAIDDADRNSVTESGDFYDDNEKYLKYYLGDPFGDEVEGRSQVISTDVQDLVESDMPSLARVFLGAGDPVEFRSSSPDKVSIQEAKDKQAMVSWIISNVKNSFRTQHDWLKGSEIQSLSPLEYGIEEVERARTKRYRGMSEEELAILMADLEDDPQVDKVDIAEQDESENPGTFDVLIKITSKTQEYFMRCVPVDDFIISRNAWNKDDADIVGKRFTKSRGQLIAEGFDYETVNTLPSDEGDENNSLKEIRYSGQGGEAAETEVDGWANQMVSGIDCYVKIDYDGDGISERRHVIKCGNEILTNEAFDHVPYAIISSMLMPNNIVGRPRAELAMQYQRTNSVLRRQILDNVYAVNNPRNVVSDAVEIDDMLDIRLNGIIRTDGNPAESVMPLVTPYIGDKALQVVQYLDSARAQSTGSLMSNQGLEADNLHKETATRFEGMEEAAKSKIELVARVIAETGYKDLWEGMAWFATHYQDTDLEMYVLGREMVVNPANWKFDHHVGATVGTGAGDDDKTLRNLSALYNAQNQLIMEGSPLADDQKRYNTLNGMVKALGKTNTSEYFNNPEAPDEIVMAENQIMKAQLKQMQEQMQSPLAEAEQVKAQASIEKEMMQQKFNAQLEQYKTEAKAREEQAKQMAKYQTDLQDLQFKYAQLTTKTGFDYSKLEVENSVDIPGEGQGQ